jgi:hypothetical protein
MANVSGNYNLRIQIIRRKITYVKNKIFLIFLVIQKPDKMKNKRLKSLVCIFGICLIFSACGNLIPFEKQLEMAATETNKSCPKMIDETTRLDKVEAFPGKIFQYNYTLINTKKEELDSTVFDSLMREQLLGGVKASPELKIFRDNQVTLIYNYSDKEGMVACKITIKPEEY